VLSDGRIVVGDGGTQELRVFDSTGTWLATWSRQGQGPGEFDGLGALFRAAGDTVLAYDYGSLSLTTIGPTGTFVARTRLVLPLERYAARPVGVLGKGGLVVAAQPLAVPGDRPGVRRDTLQLYAGFRGAGRGDSLGPVPGDEAVVASTANSVAIMSRPFGKVSVIVVSEDRIYVGAADGFAFDVRGPDGRVRRIVRRAFDQVPVTKEDLDRYFALEFAAVPSTERESSPFLKMAREAPLPDAKPPFTGALVSQPGDLWVAEFVDPGDDRRTYSVFDTTGRWVARVPMPARFRPTVVADTWMVGVWYDQNDVPHVRRYGVRRRP